MSVRWVYAALLLVAAASVRFAALPAGRATVTESGRAAFTQHVPDLDERQLRAFALGNRIFSTDWIAAPASVDYFDGLGPYFSQRSCSGCHLRDGRGRPGSGTEDEPGNLVIGLGREDSAGALAPDPIYGEQLSERALPGLVPEGHVSVTWLEKSVFFADGQVVSLRRPQYELKDLGYGPLRDGTAIQPRLAPAMPGVGLLEAIPDSAILAREDPDDRDHDGISGRARRVTTPSGVRVGRFGWKASMVTIRDQVARALRLDIGITSRVHPTSDETATQSEALARPNGGSPEVSDEALDAVASYCASLGVPARRGVNDPGVLRGSAAFDEAGCARCHGGVFLTGDSPFLALAHQRIEPGSDLLLHDMGPDLADRVSARTATGSEWRTPPLWGLGLHEHVTGYRFLLHDGRARTLTEAILWHGGEAGASRDAFAKMPAAKRRDLLSFLESL